MKHVVKPIEQKIVLEERQPPHIFTQKSITNRKQNILQPKYFLAQQQSDAPDVATECNVQCQQYNRRPTTTNIVYQPGTDSDSDDPNGEVVDDNIPLGFHPVYYKQSFPSSFQH